jgi:CDP-glucose 4,6-dehydratase
VKCLITGHTGFKGSWLALYLNSLGHEVSGIALDPASGGIFELAQLDNIFEEDFRIDITDSKKLTIAINQVRPDVIYHLAAQPLVVDSYARPRETIETNVIGTLNVLQAIKGIDSLKAVLAITTDKVYRNVNKESGYSESEPLGGEDLYSASKSMADIMIQAWNKSFHGPPLVTLRAGNVIGGGDVSPNRLVPDLIHAYQEGRAPTLRYPNAVRPWQHVLDCIAGYVSVAEFIINGGKLDTLNIGPGPESFVTVMELAKRIQSIYASPLAPQVDESERLPEANLLALDASNAFKLIGWQNQLDFQSTISWTTEWEIAVNSGLEAREFSELQIEKFRLLEMSKK